MRIWKVGLIVGVVAAALAAGTGTAFSEDRLVRDRAPSRGPAVAGVTLVEFCDFECPFCAAAQGVVNRLGAAYPTQMRFVYRHYPVERIHADAGRAAEASMCAQDQGHFWDMYSSLLANQTEMDRSSLLRQAADLGLDTRAFARCLDSGQHRMDWKRDQADGNALGVSGTPSFFVNGKFVEGADIDKLDRAVRDALGLE